MVFKVIESDITKSGQALSIFGKQLRNVYRDMSSAISTIRTNGLTRENLSQLAPSRILGNTLSQQDVQALRDYNNVLRNGITYTNEFGETVNRSVSANTAFYRCLGNSSSAAQELARNANGAAVSEEALRTATNNLTLAQKAANAATKALVVGLNLIGNIAFAIAINFIITKITEAVNKEKELRQSISETAEEAKRQTDSLNSLIKSYEEFADKTEYTVEEKERLKDIQDQLAESYHNEVSDIDLVNGKYDEQIAKLKELQQEKLKNTQASLTAERTYAKKDTENVKGNDLNTKIKFQESDFTLDTDAYKEMVAKIEKATNHGDGTGAFYTGLFGETLKFSGTADQRVKDIKAVMGILEQYGYTATETYAELSNLYDKTYELIDAEDKATYNLADNMLQQYLLTDNGNIDKVNEKGKEAYLSWRDGLLQQAKGDSELQSALSSLAEKQFPDYANYFNNLTKAKSMFVKGKINAKPISDFLEEKLTPEDLEIATQIPDLFADGLEGATKKIEAWKKQNSIEAEVKITIDDALEGQANKIKAITSAMEDMSETGYITSETYAELAKLGGNFTDCLEWENGKLKLNVDKLKDLEIQQLATAKSANSLAISELELKAASLAAHGQDFSDIQAQIESLMKENAVYTQLMEEIANAKPDDKSSSEKSEEPESVTQFKKALAEKEHLLNTNQISEQEYYEWLDSESKRVYGNLADYEEDLWKYEEQVYKWRQEQEQDLFDKKIENYKKLSDNALDKYVDGNGNELTVNASFDYARSQINSAITETQNRINELSLKKGFDDEIEELTSDLEGLYDTLEDINKQEIESQKEYIQTLKDEYSDLMDEQIDQQKKLAEEIEKSYENRISAIDKQIDSLKKVSEAEERQKSILEAEKDVKEAMLELDKAKTKKRLVYSGDGSWHLKEDTSAVKEAQDNLAEKQEALDEAKQDEQIAKLEEQKEILETQKDNSKEYYDKVVEDLESQKEAREKQYDILIDIYEQLGGDKKQTSLNESLIAKLTSNGDINKAVQGLTPTEMKQAITSGVLTTDSNGNYAIDYSILGKNEQAVKDNTAELEKLNNQLSGKSDAVDSNTPTYNNKNLDTEGYLIGADGKRILNDGKPIHAKNFSDEIAKRNTSKKMTDVVKGIGKFAGYDTMQDLIDAMITGEYIIPKSQLSNFMGSTINPKISQNMPRMGEYLTNAVNNTAPPINFTVNVDGSADEKTIQAMEMKIGNMLINYTDKLTSSIANSSLRRQNKS